MKIPAINTWHVSTEGDCEGRTTKNLGVHTGLITEIAKKLSGEAYYALDFKETIPDSERKFKAPRDQVDIRISSKNGYNDVSPEECRDMLRGYIDQHRVEKGDYGKIRLLFACTPEEKAKFARDAAIAEARAKLTPESFKLLVGETK